MRGRLVTAQALGMAFLISLAAPAVAATPPTQPPPPPTDGLGVVSVTITLPGSPGTDGKYPTVDGVSLDPCTYLPSPDQMAEEIYDGNNNPPEADVLANKVVWFFIDCPGQTQRSSWTLTGQPIGPAPPTPGQLAALAAKQIPLTATAPVSNPDVGLVNMPEWFAIGAAGWEPIDAAPLTLRGTTVAVTAQPYYAVWTPGDGSPAIRCDGPGIVYVNDTATPPGGDTYCEHKYLHDSGGQPLDSKGDPAYQANVTVYWRISWFGSAPGGPVVTGTLPDIPMPAAFQVPVQQMETIVTSGGG